MHEVEVGLFCVLVRLASKIVSAVCVVRAAISLIDHFAIAIFLIIDFGLAKLGVHGFGGFTNRIIRLHLPLKK